MSTIYGDGVLLINGVPIADTKGGEFVTVTHTEEESADPCWPGVFWSCRLSALGWPTAAQVQWSRWKAFERALDRLLRGW